MIITDFNLFEALGPYQNCVIYFMSAKDKEGHKKLYVTTARSLKWTGKTYVADLTNDIYRVYEEDEKFFTKKVEPLDGKVKKKMGISGNYLFLNEKKTPMHKISRYHKDISKSLGELGKRIQLCYPEIDFKLLY